MKFQDYEYTRPDVDALVGELKALTEKVVFAENVQTQLDAYHELDQLSEEFISMASIAHIRHDGNGEDPFYNAENDFYDQILPVVMNEMTAFTKALSESRFRDGLTEALGEFTMEKIDYQVKSMDEKLIPLMQEENQLVSQYYKLYSSAQIPFDGKTLTVEQMRPYKASEDRAVRKAAYAAEGTFFESIGDELDEIYDKMVKNRNQQAKLLGYDNYTEMALILMNRHGYGIQDIKNFRDQVARDLVPVVTEMKKVQAKRIGIDDWKAYDDLVMFPDGNPTPKGTPEELVEKARQMYHKLSPETGEFFDFMVENGLLDLVARKGKAPGGYCTSIPKYQAPFIFSNFNGSAGDVEVLTHEAGHAFEGYNAIHQPETKDDSYKRRISMEQAEVHSMSMEFLTAPYREMLMGGDAAKYELQHAENALSFIPYACIIDAFQYSAYENPDWSPADRKQEWKRLLEEFQPHMVDYDDIPFYSTYAGWQYKMHVFASPLYYIDYALAEVCALQFFLLSLEDPDKAWETYMKFVKSSGTRRFADTVTYVGLKSPFEEGTVKYVADRVGQWVREHQI